MPYYVHVLINGEGKTCVGHAKDLQRRVAQHNDPEFRGTLHTKRHRGPWRLVHSESFQSCSEAVRRERELKTGKGRQWLKGEVLRGC